jgi:hypothetical protein
LLLLSSQVDRAIKGLDPSDPWRLMQDLALGIAGVPGQRALTQKPRLTAPFCH